MSLTLRAASRLRAKKLYTSSIVITLETLNKQYLKGRVKIAPSSDSITLTDAALKCCDNLLKGNQAKIIKKVAICFVDVKPQSDQLDFFDAQANKVNYKKNLLSSAMDKLNSKYGKDTISLGQIPKKSKQQSIVAFGYIPETDE